MAKPPKKQRLSVYLEPDVMKALAAHAARRDQSLSLIAEAGIAVETLAVFIRFWLTTNPPLPEPAQAAARAKAGERYEAFVTALGRRLAHGPKLRQEISEDITPAHDAD